MKSVLITSYSIVIDMWVESFLMRKLNFRFVLFDEGNETLIILTLCFRLVLDPVLYSLKIKLAYIDLQGNFNFLNLFLR